MPHPREDKGPFDDSVTGTDLTGGMGGPVTADAITPRELPKITPRVTPVDTGASGPRLKFSPGHQGVVQP